MKDFSNGGMQPPQAPQITPDIIRNSPNIICECGGMIFSEKMTFKKLSAIISPSGKEELVPLPVMVCEKCKKVPDIFDPQQVIAAELKSKSSFTSVILNNITEEKQINSNLRIV